VKHATVRRCNVDAALEAGARMAQHRGVIIDIVAPEPWEEDYFAEKLAEHTLRAASALDEVPADSEILCLFITHAVSRAFLDAHPALRLIATRSSSLEHLDLAECAQRQVAVRRVAHYSDASVAEHSFALLLAVARRLREAVALKSSGDFSYEATRGLELAGKTLGIIGIGQIGRRVARLARAFEMQVVATDLARPTDLANEMQIRYVSLEELLPEAHAISLHVQLSQETYHILNRTTLAQCRPGVLIINTARGALIDTDALREGLDAGHIGGAGLDVLQDERVLRDTPAHIISKDIVRHLRSDAQAHEARDAARLRELQELMFGDALLSRHNVVFTPHIAFNTVEATARMLAGTVENILGFIAEEARGSG
jgi:D-lactate dehydrogenase